MLISKNNIMANNKVKIAVQDEEGNSSSKKEVKPKPKKEKLVKKAVPRSASSPRQSSGQAGRAKKEKLARPAAKKKSSGGGIWRTLTMLVITAAIVGGGIYIWQQQVTEKSIDKIESSARDTRLSFEDRINNLKNKLTGVETENVDLKETAESLLEKLGILSKAKLEFVSDELGLKFEYPASLGEATAVFDSTGAGTKFIASFSEAETVTMGGVSEDYVVTGTTTVPAVTDTQGFVERRRTYYILGPGEAEYEVNPAQVIDLSDGEALLIDRNSFVIDPEADGLPMDIGQNVAVFVNLESDDYLGFSIMNSNFEVLPLEQMIEMVEGMEIK